MLNLAEQIFIEETLSICKMAEEKITSELPGSDEKNLKEKLFETVKKIPKGESASERPPLVRKLTLCSVLPQQMLLSQLDSGFIAEPNDKKELLRFWENAKIAYNECGPSSRSYITTDDIKQIDGVEPSIISNTLNQVKNYGPYDSHPTNIYNVRISKLITPQITVDVIRAEKRAPVKRKMTSEELFDMAFKSSGQTEPITRQIIGLTKVGGALLFTSYNEDIRLHHPPNYRNLPVEEKDGESPTLENICFPIGGGLPFAAAYRIQIAPGTTRLILANGIHRVYRLASAGYEWCPLLVCDLIPLEIPDPFVNLPKSILLDPKSNPPLITDFLNKDVVIPLNYFSLLKTIRLNWNSENYVTVLK